MKIFAVLDGSNPCPLVLDFNVRTHLGQRRRIRLGQPDPFSRSIPGFAIVRTIHPASYPFQAVCDRGSTDPMSWGQPQNRAPLTPSVAAAIRPLTDAKRNFNQEQLTYG
ncbi:hypothetical protein [Oscillatoria sp. FACHB-1406]|uniref:hypothetical protein n=1 Tax=Oscillatoria sp. FACHB-1406 TaxID=2692846 RepID=UPI001686C470|nr:hypothetical protein [Oscillatoria sp. FACHB-1406]MBD2580151.1 hypothetical protein [Oscillatoria sp. FACHB-1406]